MKKVVAFLLVFLIFVTPITTFVKADVVIGDNDDTIINQNASILGRKLALMESLSDLALSGVTEFTISNTNDVDSYLDYLWNEIDNAIDSLSDGTGFTEISNQLKSKYFTNLVQYKDYITNRGNYLAQLLPTGNPTTTLLSTFFADNIYGKQTIQHYDLALDMFRSLSALNNNVTPNPNPDFSFISYDNDFYISGTDVLFYGSNLPVSINTTQYLSVSDKVNYTAVRGRTYNSSWSGQNTGYNSNYDFMLSPLVTFYINSNQDDSVTVIASNFQIPKIIPSYDPNTSTRFNGLSIYRSTSHWANGNIGLYRTYNELTYNTDVNRLLGQQSSFPGLSTAINWIHSYFRHYNLYVDDIPWLISNSTNNPILDIDGYIKIYGNENPQQYELQPNTQIDYDQLYQVIYNAIRDNLPISQGDINYYDSHDTIYSPTIINNYGEEEGDESDLIDTILDYAVIPKFDTAIAQPMRQALTNGVVIMNNSITNVIPNEILLILGACFFLLLFAVVINRMIK